MYMDLPFESTEAAYQAAKSPHPCQMTFFIGLRPYESKKLGRKISIRRDWEQIKISIMMEILRIKFQQPKYKELLLSTGNMILEEGNYWKDYFWGICPEGSENGKNMLGHCLMEIREELTRGVQWVSLTVTVTR